MTSDPSRSNFGNGLVLSRFETELAPIVLSEKETASSGSTCTIACDVLEERLDDCLDPVEEFPVEYPQPEEALLLQCRIPRPKSLLQQSADSNGAAAPLASITGIPEEFSAAGGGGDDTTRTTTTPHVKIQVLRGTTNGATTTSPSTEHQCAAPHSEWKRQSLDHINNQLEPTNNKDSAATVQWIDLRDCGPGPLLFPSLTSVAHFFRSLLGTSHQKSPWCPQNDTRMNPNQRVAVLFSGEASDYLFDVRVNDICPSWSLFSVSKLQIGDEVPWQGQSQSTTTKTACTLVIFKPLPPRPLLMSSQPIIHKLEMDETHLTELPQGCLWEVYMEYKEEQDDNDDDNGTDEKKATTKARKVPHCRMTAPPYVSHAQDYDEALLQPLLDHWEVIRDEALQIPQWTAWPETQHYSKATSRRDDDNSDDADEPFHPSWNVFPLCHCFPANQPEKKQWITQTCALVPRTVELLQQHLGPLLRTALFSRLDPETTLEAHTGWSDLANYVLRCHLPLVVPPGGVCGTWVDGCVETHAEGRFLCFDDSKTHRAFNYSTQERIVLILDLARPPALPLGTATGGHSDELDQFIAQMNV